MLLLCLMAMRICAFLLVTLASLSLSAAEPPVQSQVFLSKVYTIDRKYRSMEGPGSIDQVYLGDPARPELLWVIRIRTEMVGEDGRTAQLPELMCHVNVDLDPARHSALFNLSRATATRLITLSQGMIDARLPRGFAYPISSSEPLSVFTQVLNLNIETPRNLKVRHRLTFEYIRDRELKTPMQALFNVGASGTVLLKDGETAMPSMTMAVVPGGTSTAGGHGTSCLVGPRAPNAAGGAKSDYTDPLGRRVTGHWVVPPGRQVNTSDITWFMQLPVDTRLHWAAAHLHPYAKSLAIRDATTGELVFEVKARGPAKGIGLTKVETFTSIDGVPMHKDHKYELTSVYENPTREDSDSMASAFLALADPDFVRPDPATLAARSATLLDQSAEATAVVRTSEGDFGLAFMRTESPAAVRRFLRLARTGAFEGVSIAMRGGSLDFAAGPLSDLQRATLIPYVNERAARHMPGVLSVCPGDDTAFAIVLAPSPDRDARCTAFAHVTLGAQVIRRLSATGSSAPPSLIRIDVYENPAASQITLAPPKAEPKG